MRLQDESLLIQVNNLWKTYTIGKNTHHALRGIDLKIRNGEFILIKGPSGSGKSTLLKLLGLIDLPSKGKIHINSNDTANLSQNEKARLRNKLIGFVFQSFNLIPELKVIENVLLPNWISKEKKHNNMENALSLLRKVGLENVKTNYANQLSGGQMQRVAIARALITDPLYILADEPTGNLDTKTANGIIELFKKINKESNKTIILVSHNEKHEKDVDRTINIVDGQII